jgi:metal-responsive CopG/Arc/MetJ family transcriptional regulator
MAIVNFSVPDDVKAAFDRAFRKQNKSAIIAELMRRAVEDASRQQRRSKLFRELTARRADRPSVSNKATHAARVAARS